MNSVGYKALELAQRLAPTCKVQQAFSRLHNDLIQAGVRPEHIAVSIMRATLDGMESGNWPT